MKLKLAILDSDKEYLDRFQALVNKLYFSKVDLYIFTKIDIFNNFIEKTEIDVLLIDKKFLEDINKKDYDFDIFIFSNKKIMESYIDYKSIYKYQNIDNIFNDIYKLHKESKEYKNKLDNSKVIAFLNISGGSGNSTISKSLSICLAKSNRILYYSFDKSQNIELDFNGDNNKTFENILLELNKENSDLEKKLIESVSRDESGVFYYKSCNNILDMYQLDYSNIFDLVEKSISLKEYSYIVLDLRFEDFDSFKNLSSLIDYIFILSNNSEVSVNKINNVIKGLKIIEADKDINIIKKIYYINNMSIDNSTYTKDKSIKDLGYIEKYNIYNQKELVREISKNDVIKRISEKVI